MLSNKVYDALKWITQYLLPGFGTLYFALAEIWGLPFAKEIVGTTTAFVAFLGLLLGLSKAVYVNTGKIYDGELQVTQGPDKDSYVFHVNDLEALKSKESLRLNVTTTSEVVQADVSRK